MLSAGEAPVSLRLVERCSRGDDGSVPHSLLWLVGKTSIVGILLGTKLFVTSCRCMQGTKILATTDPDGWKVVFVDNEDFLAELK